MLYLILWGGTAFISVAMALIGQQVNEKKLLRNHDFPTQTSSGEAINDLLLSADELTIEEKKSFISLYLKSDDKTGVLTYQNNKNKTEDVYKQIFQRKVNKLKEKSSDDFSIRPLPK